MASLASAPPPLCSSPSRHRRSALPAAVRCRAHFHPQLGSHRHVSLALRTRRWLSGHQAERRMEQRKFGFIERKVANGCHRVVTRSSFNDNPGDISCFRRYNRHRMGRAWRALTDKPKFPWRGHLINRQSVKDGFVLHAAAGPDEPHVATTSWADTINENPVLRFCDPETGKMDLEGFLNSDLPSHPKLYRGQLKNGFRYIILPNKMPANRFEAHMEIHVGSVDEEDDEQGIAHMIEHVAFLGSTKREKLLSTGARSNAYTDFHHTVFHIHSPTTTEDSNGDILPSVLDALNEIAFHPKFLSSRIEKERRAILSELQMMNTMEYRIDCQLLQYLHSENKLSKRFPIGLEDQIKKWDAEKIQQFHERWYFPANVTLYIVGDISNVSEVIHQIKVFFENTLPEDNASTVSATSAFGAMANFLVPKLPGGLMGGLSSERASVSSNQSKAMKKVRHAIRPPVIHDWCIPGLAREEKLPQIFQHELIQNFSINLFCKVPVSQVKTYGALRNFAMKRIFISAFQFRINRRYKSSNPPFTSVELDHSDSGREGCTVTTLTVTAEPKNWHSAIRVAVQEVRRLKEFGVTKGELTRYLDALIKDSEQLATMIDSISSIENLDSVMEQVALGNTIMDQRQAYESLVAVVDTITLEEVNSVGSEILEFISDFGSPVAPSPAAIVACVPARVHVDGIGETQFIIHPNEIVDAIKAGQMEPIEAEPELEIPKELISPLELEKLKIERKPHFIPVNEEVDSLRIFDQETGITQRRLSNGIAVNYKITDNEIRGGVMRLIVGGGRALENFETMGAVIVGVRTLSESGCVGNFSREQVELFCVNHSVNCLLESAEELISLEFRFMVKDKGMYAAFQLLHMVLEHSVWLEEAFDRTRQMHLSWYHSIPKTLERSTSHKLVLAMLNGDERFVEPTPQSLQKLTLQSVKDAVMNQFVADNMEVSIVGDFTESDIESCILDYLGTVQARRTHGSVQCIPPIAFRPTTSDVLFQQVFIKDTDERACAYLAGPAPNRWGFDAEGKDLFELMNSKPFHADTSLSSEEAALPMRIGFLGSNQRSIRSHPLFFGVALSLLAEIINSRLFTTVRDSLGLTYDVSFELSLFDRLKLGWYVISVTSTPGKIYQAVDACKTVIRDLHSNRIVQRELDRAKRTLMMKHEAEMKLNVYWLGLMTHLQASSVPRKDISCIKNLNSLYEAATIEDIYLAYKHLKVDNDSLFSCIGIAGLQRGDDTLEAVEDEEVDIGSHHGVAPGGRGFSIMTRPTT